MARERGSLCTTRCQLFNVEIINTENKIRMRWFIRDRGRFLENLRNDKPIREGQAIREKYEEERLKRKNEKRKILEKDKSLPLWRPPKPDGSVNLDIMKPIDPSVRAILYEKGVESYTTADNYLKERYKHMPENRFYYLDCTNWFYGWRLTDYPPVPSTKVGRTAIIRDSFYRRNGSSLKHDDKSHRKCQTSNAKDFDDILAY